MAGGATASYSALSFEPSGISFATVVLMRSTLPSFSSTAVETKIGSASARYAFTWSMRRGICRTRESTCPIRTSAEAYPWVMGRKRAFPMSSTATVGLWR